jgi:hypothetical protein
MLFLEKVRNADSCLFLAAIVMATGTYSDGNPRLRLQPFADPSSQAALAETGVTMRA